MHTIIAIANSIHPITSTASGPDDELQVPIDNVVVDNELVFIVAVEASRVTTATATVDSAAKLCTGPHLQLHAVRNHPCTDVRATYDELG